MTIETGWNLGLSLNWVPGDDGWSDGMNVNLRCLDGTVMFTTPQAALAAPPGSPSLGDRYIIAPSATGAWAGKDGDLVVYQRDEAVTEDWRFYTPAQGAQALILTPGTSTDLPVHMIYRHTAWVVDHQVATLGGKDGAILLDSDHLTIDGGNTLGIDNIATLDLTGSNAGRVPLSMLPVAVSEAVHFAGTINATNMVVAAGTTLVDGTLPSGMSAGAMFKVTTAGTATLDGLSSWNVGDQIVFNGVSTTWNKIDGIASELISFGGQTGAIVESGNLRMIGTDSKTVDLAQHVTLTATGTTTILTLGRGAAGSSPDLTGGQILRLVDVAGNHTALLIDAFAATPGVHTRMANGTEASPTAVQSGNYFGNFHYWGYNGTAFVTGGGMNIYAIENWDTASNGTEFRIHTVAAGTTGDTVSMYVNNTGGTISGGILEVGGTTIVAGGTLTMPAMPAEVRTAEIEYFQAGTMTDSQLLMMYGVASRKIIPSGLTGCLQVVFNAGTTMPHADMTLEVDSMQSGTWTTQGSIKVSTAGSLTILSSPTVDVTLDAPGAVRIVGQATHDTQAADFVVSLSLRKA